MLKLRKELYLILILAAILRLTYFFVFWPPLDWENGKTFHIAAENIVLGNGYTIDGENPFIAREPGYSAFFLAPLYAITGPSVFAAEMLNIFLGLLTIVLIYKIGERVSQKIGLLSALIYAVYPQTIAFSGELFSDNAFAFILLLAVFLILRAVEKKSGPRVFLGGLFLGAAVLVKSIAALLPLFLFPFLYIGLNKKLGRAFKYFILICLGVLILIAPYAVRNYLVFDRFVFGRDDGGFNLWAGSYIPWDGEFLGNNAFPLPDLIKGLGREEADNKLRGLAVENIKEDPLGVIQIWLKKPARLLFGSEFNTVLSRDNKLRDYSKGFLNPEALKVFLLGFNIFIFGLGFLGAMPLLKNNYLIASFLILIVFYFLLFLLPFSPDSRYKLPLVPYFSILSASFILFKLFKVRP